MNELIPSEFLLSQNYPNPFKDKTVIKYCVGYKTRVVLAVYDDNGNEIEKLVDEDKKPGTYEVEFSAPTCHSRDSRNQKNAAYYYRLEAGEFINEKKMVLEK